MRILPQFACSEALSPFSVSTFPVRGLRVLRLMEEKAGRTEDRAASATGFRVRFTQLTATVKALRTVLNREAQVHRLNSSLR